MKRGTVEITFAADSDELTVLSGYANGLPDREIALASGMPYGRVVKVGAALRRYLGARDRAHAVGIGFRKGLLTGEATS